MTNKFFSLILFLLLFCPSFANAQPASAQLLYSPTTPEYLAKSFWPLKKLDENDNNNIDQYLLVTECDLYQQYHSNDIEWSKIQDATRGYIKSNRDSFPTRFEFIQPLYLDRYDVANQSFSVEKKSQIIGVSQLQASGNSTGDYPCLRSQDYDKKTFPMNAIVKLSRPLNLTSIQTNKESAAEYIKYIQDNKLETSKDRVAYVRYRFKVQQSLEPVPMGIDGGVYANFFGTLESMTIFGDKELFIKLQDVKF